MSRSRTAHVALAASVGGLIVASLTACGSSDDSSSDGRLEVAAAFFPIEEITERVGGDLVDVVALVPPGSEAHEFEPTAQQLADLENADVVFYLAGFQPNFEKVIESLPGSVQKVNLLDGITMRQIGPNLPGTDADHEDEADHEEDADHEADADHDHEEAETGSDDPHVWLAPANMRIMTATVASVLSAASTADAAAFAANAAAYTAELDTLDDAFATGLAQCESEVLVTGHQAFGYLAEAYGLTQVAIAGISPSEEPSAQTLEAIAEFASANNVSTIFFEENLPDDLARTLADEIGASTAVLSTLETLSSDQLDDGATYISVMDDNLATLRASLGCA